MSVHVLHVAQPTTEGVARCVETLAASQVRAGDRVTVACPADGWLAQEVTAAGAAHVEWEAGRSPGPAVPRETWALRRIVHDLRPDLVHLHSAKAGLAGRLAVRGRCPTVYQPHAWSFLAASGLVGRASLAWERRALRWTDTVICVSEAECHNGREHGLDLEGRAAVVPNAVDAARFAGRSREEARGRLGLRDGPLAVCVGRLAEQKGQDVLLAAWPQVVAQVPTARLVLVGEGPWRERLVASAPGSVVFAGNAIDPRDWYAAADVVVVPSRWEGMALVPLEAGASGRSVVITDVAGAREVVGDDAGAVVPVEDPAALAGALAERLAAPEVADAEGRQALAHIRRDFDIAVTEARVRAVYDRLLPSRW